MSDGAARAVLVVLQISARDPARVQRKARARERQSSLENSGGGDGELAMVVTARAAVARTAVVTVTVVTATAMTATAVVVMATAAVAVARSAVGWRRPTVALAVVAIHKKLGV